jgi:hypothetical protein
MDFLEDTAAKSASPSTFPPFQNITLEYPSEKLYGKYSKNDVELFDDVLPKLWPLLQYHNENLKFPRLKQALLDRVAKTDPITAYNEDTYIEYHLLLWEVLRLFRASLLHLESLDDNQWRGDGFDNIVSGIAIMGVALQTMAGGNIIRKHFKVITAGHGNIATMPDMPVNEEIQDDDCQRDHDLYRIIDTHPVSEACFKWLKLMIVHFDAVRILANYMNTFKPPKVTIKVIITPNPGYTQLSWKELLGDERYFEKEPPGHPTAKKIIEFIEDLQDAQKLKVDDPVGSTVSDVMMAQLNKLLDREDTYLDTYLDWNRDARSIYRSMTTMMSKRCLSSENSPFQAPLDVILHDIKSLKGVSGTSEVKRQAIKKIIKNFEDLKEDVLSFLKSNFELKNLPSISSFKGSIHCELNLACLKMLTNLPKDSKYKHVVSELSVRCIISHSNSIRLILFTI